MTDREYIMHLASPEVTHVVRNIPVPFVNSGQVTYKLITPNQEYSFSGDTNDTSLYFDFTSFSGEAILQITFDNLTFGVQTSNLKIGATIGNEKYFFQNQLDIENLTNADILQLELDFSPLDDYPMILEYEITEANQLVTLPLSGVTSVDVNWGDDGSLIECFNSDNPTHVYANTGVYTVKIYGSVSAISHQNVNLEDKKGLRKINSWGKLNGLTSMAYSFIDCHLLAYELPEDVYGNFSNVTDFSHAFHYCYNVPSISNSLFNHCDNVTSFDSCFYGCGSLTAIPNTLFNNCSNVINFNSCFYDCYGLVDPMPETLFSSSPNVTDFGNCFYNCWKITGTTPVDILGDGTRIELWQRAGKDGYPPEINGKGCFFNCGYLATYWSTLPETWK